MTDFPYLPTLDQIVVESHGPNPYSKKIIAAPGGTPLPHRGRVLAVGPGTHFADGSRVPLTCEVGDWILFHPAAGIQLDRDQRIILSDKGVLCVVPGGFPDVESNLILTV